MAKLISFAWTSPALKSGNKTVTRRQWDATYARRFKMPPFAEIGSLAKPEHVRAALIERCADEVMPMLRAIFACEVCPDAVCVPIGERFGTDPFNVLVCPACATSRTTAAGRAALRAHGYGVMPANPFPPEDQP